MDDLDRLILARLTEDGRTPYSAIASEAGVSTTTVHQRVKRLTERGVIAGTHARVDWEAVGLPVTAIVSVEGPSGRPLGEVAEDLRAIPHVQSCYAVTGGFDLLLTVRARSSQHLGQVLDAIRRYTPGPSRTIVVLATYYENRVPPIPGPDEDAT